MLAPFSAQIRYRTFSAQSALRNDCQNKITQGLLPQRALGHLLGFLLKPAKESSGGSFCLF